MEKLLDQNTILDVLIVDPEPRDASRLEAVLASLRTRTTAQVRSRVSGSIPDAYQTIPTTSSNVIFIDPLSGRLHDTITFIQHVRLMHPTKFVFVLYCSQKAVAARQDELFSGWAERLRHYFILDKDLGDADFEHDVIFNLVRAQMDLHAYAMEKSLSDASEASPDPVLSPVQLSKLETQVSLLSRQLSSLHVGGVGARESFAVSEKRAFVVMSFLEQYNDVYLVGMKEVLSRDLGFEVIRMDELFHHSLIISRVYTEIQRCGVVIAELSEPSPNCYYELGFADALGKPVIRFARQGTKPPFDVNQYPFHFYSSITDFRAKLSAALQRLVSTDGTENG
jgi:hypothetical protein